MRYISFKFPPAIVALEYVAVDQMWFKRLRGASRVNFSSTYIDGLVQKGRNSCVLGVELRLFGIDIS